MGTKPRPRPELLASKLRTIRDKLGLSQSQMARRLDAGILPARISEYELGHREPSLLTLLAYARVAHVSMERIVDDVQQLPDKFL